MIKLSCVDAQEPCSGTLYISSKEKREEIVFNSGMSRKNTKVVNGLVQTKRKHHPIS